ncbi:hypothetical protein BDZ97DRAFT_1648569 [Flammula alnicola]|nr:hypothetical protein BDZ97DRAFT_1648569 [Flammula alnicola]
MATYTSSVTPRLRVARNSPLNYDRSSQIASASESGPSRLPEFSQLVDLNLNDMAMSEASDQLSTSTIPAPSTSTRSENPAAVLRALLSRLPAQSKSPTPSQSPSQQYLSERESDYDMDISERGNATPSMAQESLKDIFSKARRDPGDTPQKMRPRRNSVDTSEVDASPRVEKQRADHKGKRRSLSDDEMDNANRLSQRRATRFKPSPQPITMEFLRERFSDSRVSHGSVEDEGPLSIHNSSNDTATILRDLKSLQSTPPAATSTPQQSLRLSVNSQFQSNLLDQDTEMQNAIDELDSYGERSAERSSKH